MKRSNTKYVVITLLIVFLLIVLLIWLKDQQSPSVTSDSTQKKEEKATPFVFDYLPAYQNGQLIKHTNFSLVYSEKDEQALWVTYQLTRKEVEGLVDRTDNFREDPLITTGSATPDDYRRSGFDRGHLAPAGDMGFSEKAMSESFYMSNISPQLPAFNRGVWKELEEQTRRWVSEKGDMYVVTGPVLKGRRRKKIGENEVTVPSRFFKVLLFHPTENQLMAVAFLLPNKGTDQPLQSFVVSIDQVEEVSGLDLFPELPDEQENALEAQVDVQDWFSTITH